MFTSNNMGGRSSKGLTFFIASEDEGIQMLNTAEEEDKYREECRDCILNNKARERQIYKPYRLTIDMIDIFRPYYDSIALSVPSRLKYELGDVNIVYLSANADGGMPHTRPGNVICLPYRDEPYPISTMYHELWHIHQRKYPEFWRDALKRAWNCEPYTKGGIPAEYERLRRINPDTMDEPYWIWNGVWITIPVFENITQPNLRDTAVLFYNVHSGYHARTMPRDLREFFSERLSASAFEHPYEMVAYILTEEEGRSTEAYKRLIGEIGKMAAGGRD